MMRTISIAIVSATSDLDRLTSEEASFSKEIILLASELYLELRKQLIN